ncbi:MAG: hypothetical protein U5M50_14835 [Sphingobium sp.]|nr:hypothetical protein [Sphingobium sp.]
MLCIANSTYVDSEDRPAARPRGLAQTGQRRWSDVFADLPEALRNTLVMAQRCAVAARRIASRSCPALRATARARRHSCAAMRAPGWKRGCATAIGGHDGAFDRSGVRAFLPITTGSRSRRTSSSRWAFPATS